MEKTVEGNANEKQQKTKPKNNKNKNQRPKRPTKQKFTFPASEIHHMLAKGRVTVAPEVSLSLAAAEQYVVHELIELAGNHALSRRSGTIDVEDVVEAINSDSDLRQLLGEVLGTM
ncbi:uncharacterized protein LOC129216021 [Uloborus diversus]|uniref:uncharacterized protein LOC129216021 n=1 Tax=Uloborus diversus TaxID=327109 RepID=UPI002409AC1C|nr:uncharacterized protein LOC129216021 [Uloborus diversus]